MLHIENRIKQPVQDFQIQNSHVYRPTMFFHNTKIEYTFYVNLRCHRSFQMTTNLFSHFVLIVFKIKIGNTMNVKRQ